MFLCHGICAGIETRHCKISAVIGREYMLIGGEGAVALNKHTS